MEMHWTAQWDCEREISGVKGVCRSGKCSDSPAVSRLNSTLVFSAQLDLTFYVNEQLHFCSAYQIAISEHRKITKTKNKKKNRLVAFVPSKRANIMT